MKKMQLKIQVTLHRSGDSGVLKLAWTGAMWVQAKRAKRGGTFVLQHDMGQQVQMPVCPKSLTAANEQSIKVTESKEAHFRMSGR